MVKTLTSVKINLSSLITYQRSLDKRNHKVYGQWAVRFRSFIQFRYDKFSKGGGDWPALKTRSGSILRDTNTMFTALAPTLIAPPGSINKFIMDGIEVGFGGSAGHPEGPTIRQLAVWNQIGAGNLPIRKIIVPPDSKTIDAMREDMKKAHPQ